MEEERRNALRIANQIDPGNTLANYVQLVFKYYNIENTGTGPAAQRLYLCNPTASTFLPSQANLDFGWRRIHPYNADPRATVTDLTVCVAGYGNGDDDAAPTLEDIKTERCMRLFELQRIVNVLNRVAPNPKTGPNGAGWGNVASRNPDGKNRVPQDYAQNVLPPGAQAAPQFPPRDVQAIFDNELPPDGPNQILNYGPYPIGLFDDPIKTRRAALSMPVMPDMIMDPPADNVDAGVIRQLRPLFVDVLSSSHDGAIGYSDPDQKCVNRWGQRTLQDYQTLRNRFPTSKHRGYHRTHHTDPAEIYPENLAYRDFANYDGMNRTDSNTILNHRPAFSTAGSTIDAYPPEIVRMYAMAWFAKTAIMRDDKHYTTRNGRTVQQVEADRWYAIETWKRTPLGAYIDTTCMPYKNNYTVVIKSMAIARALCAILKDIRGAKNPPLPRNFMEYDARLWSNIDKSASVKELAQWLAAPSALPCVFGLQEDGGNYYPLEMQPDYVFKLSGKRIVVCRVPTLQRDPAPAPTQQSSVWTPNFQTRTRYSYILVTGPAGTRSRPAYKDQNDNFRYQNRANVILNVPTDNVSRIRTDDITITHVFTTRTGQRCDAYQDKLNPRKFWYFNANGMTQRVPPSQQAGVSNSDEFNHWEKNNRALLYLEWWRTLCTALAVWTHYGRMYRVTASMILLPNDVSPGLKTNTQAFRTYTGKITPQGFKTIFKSLIIRNPALGDMVSSVLPENAQVYDYNNNAYVHIGSAAAGELDAVVDKATELWV